jgi:hypothetical protein
MPVNPSEAQLDIIFYHSAYPLWKFMIQKFEIDIRDVCARVAKDEPKLVTNKGTYYVRTVANDYNNVLGEEHTENVTFLLNSVNVVFNSLKDGIIRNGERILHPYYFQLDEHSNLELVLVDGPEDANYIKSVDDRIKLGIVFDNFS